MIGPGLNKEDTLSSEILDSVNVNGTIYAVTKSNLVQYNGSVSILYAVPPAGELTCITYDPVRDQIYLGGWVNGNFGYGIHTFQ